MEILFTTTAVAGGAVLWRNWLEHHENWKNYLKKKLGVFNKALLCGSCFTYWLALFALLINNPFEQNIKSDFLFFFASWMSIAYIAVLMRFSYILIQESVSEKVHRHDHKH